MEGLDIHSGKMIYVLLKVNSGVFGDITDGLDASWNGITVNEICASFFPVRLNVSSMHSGTVVIFLQKYSIFLRGNIIYYYSVNIGIFGFS